jgi:MFS family permease
VSASATTLTREDYDLAMPAQPGPVAGPATGPAAAGRPARLLEPWFTPFALVNGGAVGLTPILLPLAAAGQGAGHVGLVMGAFNLGAFGVNPQTSSIAFAVIVFVSLPLFIVAGRVSQRRGPRAVMAGGMAARVVLLALLAILAANGSVPPGVPLAAFGGIMFAWSFLSVASPGLTGQLVPQAEGEAQGVLNASSGIAGFAGSVIGGLVASQAGYAAALGLGAAAVAAGLLIFIVKLLRPRAAATVPSAAPAPD